MSAALLDQRNHYQSMYTHLFVSLTGAARSLQRIRSQFLLDDDWDHELYSSYTEYPLYWVYKRRYNRLLKIVYIVQHRYRALCQAVAAATVVVEREVYVRLDPRTSQWYRLYVNAETNQAYRDPQSREGKLFRRRFRVPHAVFISMWQEAVAERWFPQHMDGVCDASGRPCVPLPLLILGVLRVLGRAHTFDDVCEFTFISENTCRVFFLEFCRTWAKHKYPQLVKSPQNAQEAAHHEQEYRLAGFNGCIGSIDCVHIAWWRTPITLQNMCIGKEGFPTLVYQLACNHRRQILHTVGSFVGNMNDKAITRHDEVVNQLRDGTILQDFSFELFDKNGMRTVHRTPYYLCDGGYHQWACLMNPIQAQASDAEFIYSEWLESMRKDVECVFGILKARFRILKTGLYVKKRSDCEAVWRTCCAMHNMLLDFDGRADVWTGGVAAPDGDAPYDQFEAYDMPPIFERIQKALDAGGANAPANVGVRVAKRDLSSIGLENVTTVEVHPVHREFRNKLVEHFSYRHALPQGNPDRIVWPRANAPLHPNAKLHI